MISIYKNIYKMSDNKNILQKIVENKKQELEKNKSNWEKFKKIFKEKNANLIAEIKLASPKFDYSKEINIEEVFKHYWENKSIKAVSNLIDQKYFSWDISRWKIFKQKYNKPIFFKEFVVNNTQIDWASYFWYDAILLLERVLSEEKLVEFSQYAIQKNIFPIIEVDNKETLEKILTSSLAPLLIRKGKIWIAVNCRNLWTMEIDRKKHFSIIEWLNKKLENTLIFAFSWIDNLEQLKEYKWIYNWVLVGSYFMDKLKNNN